MMMKRFLYIALLAVLQLPAFAQKATEEFRKIMNAYQKPSLSFDGGITMHAKGQPQRILETLPVSYRMSGGTYHCKLGKVEISGGEQYMVQIDHEDKRMIVARRQQAQNMQVLPVMDLSELKKHLADPEESMRLIKGAKTNKLQIAMPYGSGIQFYELEYDIVTFYVQKVVMEMVSDDGGDAMVLVMQYKHFSTAAFAPCCKQEDYFKVNGQRVQVNSAYANYKLISEL